MIRFEGEREFHILAEELFTRLTDVRFLVQCLPDVESVQGEGPDQAQLVLRPGLAFIRGKLEATVRVVERQPSTFARLAVSSRGIGSSSEVEASLAFLPEQDRTRVRWTMQILSLGGLLKMVPTGLIRGAAEKVVKDAWNAIEARLSAPAAPPG
jgi:carbon monoxide dehydrogenase subunit G